MAAKVSHVADWTRSCCRRVSLSEQSDAGLLRMLCYMDALLLAGTQLLLEGTIKPPRVRN